MPGAEMRMTALGRIVQACWEETPAHFPNVEVDTFIVMPNHIHGIIFIHEATVGARYISPLRKVGTGFSPLQEQPQTPHGFKPGSVGAIVASFKSAVTRQAGKELGLANIWQRNYYEHIIRNQTDYERIVGYILNNPSNWDQDEENPL
jgi:REP element-mobilizing transposase RayT